MTGSYLVRLFEHNNWANLRIIRACANLSDEQLDAEPRSATKGTIRRTLTHLVSSQGSYLSLLTLPVNERADVRLDYAQLQESARISGVGLLELAKGDRIPLENPLRTTDDYFVEPWVVMLQAINHATEHREQICSMLTALGITPPDLDGWSYGEVVEALVPVSR